MHCGYITKIKGVKKHSNADRLMVGNCFGNQVIIGLDVLENELGVYFPSDLQLGLEFCEANNLLRKKDSDGKDIGGYLDSSKRNIRAMRLRGEVSDGLWMNIKCLENFTDTSKLKEGDQITILNGVEVCRKYIPKVNKTRVSTPKKGKSEKKESKTKFPIFNQHIDTGQLAYNKHVFNKGDVCYITLKMHGTSGRSQLSLKEKKIYYKGIRKVINNILKKDNYRIEKSWDYVCGSRRVVLKDFEGGYHGSNDFRKLHHDKFKGKLNKGETVYYEIVGYQSEDKPIMGTVANKKTGDKGFIKKYGEKTVYSYGCENGESDIYIYRMSMTNEDGVEIDYPWDLVKQRAEQMGIKITPELDRFIYTTEEDLMHRIKKYEDGEDPIGRTHIREGVVVRIEGKERFKALKSKSFIFKLLEGIIKDSGVVDIEEAQSELE